MFIFVILFINGSFNVEKTLHIVVFIVIGVYFVVSSLLVFYSIQRFKRKVTFEKTAIIEYNRKGQERVLIKRVTDV